MRKRKLIEKSKDKLFPRVSTTIIILLFFVWTYFVLTNYFKAMNFNPLNPFYLELIFSTRFYPERFSLKFVEVFLGHLLNVLITFIIFVAAYGLGIKIWSVLKFNIGDDSTNLERLLFQTALGIGGIIFFTLGIGLSGLLYAPIVWCFVLIFACFGLQEIIRTQLSAKTNSNKKKYKIFSFTLIVLLLAILVNLSSALVPETFYDSLAYNVGLSQNWINHNKIFSTRFMHTSFYPLNITVLYTLGILLKNDIVAKLMVFMFGLGMFFTTYAFCKRYFSSEIGFLAGVIFYTTPIVMLVSWKTAVEVPLGFFEFLAVFCFFNWWNYNKAGWLYLAGIFSGFALGGKYTSFFTATTLFLMLITKLFFIDKNNLLVSIKKSLPFCLTAFFIPSVWFIRNTITIGNPLYPLLSKLGGQLSLGGDPPHIITKFTLQNILLFPWKYTMGELQQETILGPVFLLVLPLLILFKGVNKNVKLLYIYFTIYFIFWLAIGKAYLRFLIPALPVISIIVGYYVTEANFSKSIKKWIVIFLLVVSSANIYNVSLIQKHSMDPLGYLIGMQSKRDYLSTQRPTYPCAYYPGVEWLNNNLKPTDKVLLLGECRGFYLKRKYISHMVGDITPLVSYCREVSTADELYHKFKKEGITYMLLNMPEAKRLAGYDIFDWDGNELKIFTEFWNKYVVEVQRFCADVTLSDGSPGSTVPEFWNRYISDETNYIYVYKILSPEEAKTSHQQPVNFFLSPSIYSSERFAKLKPTIELILSRQ